MATKVEAWYAYIALDELQIGFIWATRRAKTVRLDIPGIHANGFGYLIVIPADRFDRDHVSREAAITALFNQLHVKRDQAQRMGKAVQDQINIAVRGITLAEAQMVGHAGP